MRTLSVHLTPSLVEPSAFSGGVAVIADVLRATTTIVHALAAGAASVVPVTDVDEARRLYAESDPSIALLAGERGGLKIDGFHLGNSPSEFSSAQCQGKHIYFTTTNGTRAINHASAARRRLIGAFVNRTATCREILAESGPIHILCAGTEGRASLEDTLFAGSIVQRLMDEAEFELNDGARLAWDTMEGHGTTLLSALELSEGGQNLLRIGLEGDIPWAARIDRLGVVVECLGNPTELRITTNRWEG